MKLSLTIYTDDSLKTIKRVAEADSLKIPYRVAAYIAQSLDRLDIKNNNDILNLVGGSVEHLDKIIKATFGLSDGELDCVNAADLGAVGVEIYKWGIEKFNSIKGNDSKNVATTA